ncbi:hypothetical protein EDC04DRAFT_3052536 [Pisolithus marmoratus]|nr:hypothetical protein EDC04DRAFT_3052536 [Pisolithus marmoratus]
MPALPPTLESCRDQPSVLSAYNLCLRLEEKIQREIDSGKNMKREMMYCRILGYLFHHLPAPAVKGNFVDEVTAIGSNDEKLLELGMHFYEHFIKPFMSNKGCPPTPPSRRTFFKVLDKPTGFGPPTNHDTAKKHALIRDGFKCVVTKMYDGTATWRQSELRRVIEGGEVPTLETRCTHILPQSIVENITSDSSKSSYTTAVWKALNSFGDPSLRKLLDGTNIHRIQNVMTMDPTVDGRFNTLKIWFVPTGETNSYRLEAIDEFWLTGRPRYVTFSTPNANRYPLPSATYLAIHATCAKVAHLSGTREYLETILTYMDDTHVLSEDGGSSELLHEAILRIASI